MTRSGAGQALRCLLLGMLALGLGACNQSEGQGQLWGELDWEDCQELRGPFEMELDFFAFEPFEPDSALLRLQEGGRGAEQADGLMLTVYDLPAVQQLRGEPIAVSPLDPALAAAGEYQVCQGPADQRPAECPLVRAELYLTQRCPPEATNLALSGSVLFSYLGSEPDERVAGSLELDAFDRERGMAAVGHLSGQFEFVVRRGHPYQRFPR